MEVTSVRFRSSGAQPTEAWRARSIHMTQRGPLVTQIRTASRVAPSSQIAPVDSTAPANGIVGASQLFDGVYSRSDSKLAAMLRDAQYRVLGLFVAHLLGQDAGFFRSLVPIFGVVDIRYN